jgi:hypothetical protein
MWYRLSHMELIVSSSMTNRSDKEQYPHLLLIFRETEIRTKVRTQIILELVIHNDIYPHTFKIGLDGISHE